jgi:hypothetical protein
MSLTFSSPKSGGGDRLNLADVNGHVVLIYVKAFEPEITTSMGTASAVRLDVVDLDTGDHYLDVLWFAKVIVSKLRDLAGQAPVLAQITQGTAKPGQSAPWELTDASASEKATAAATAWLAANPGIVGLKLSAPAGSSTMRASDLL